MFYSHIHICKDDTRTREHEQRSSSQMAGCFTSLILLILICKSIFLGFISQVDLCQVQRKIGEQLVDLNTLMGYCWENPWAEKTGNPIQHVFPLKRHSSPAFQHFHRVWVSLFPLSSISVITITYFCNCLSVLMSQIECFAFLISSTRQPF